MKRLTPAQLYKRLSAPLPDEALEPIGDTGRVGIKVAYEIERLNKIFGPGVWKTTLTESTLKPAQEDSTLWIATTKCTLTVEAYKIHHEQFGGHTSADQGDALKGAGTDAFGKCCSLLGIGIEVYKGLKNNQNMPREEQYSQPDALGTQHSRVSRFVFHSGVIVACANGSQNGVWVNISGVTCLIPDEILFAGPKTWKITDKMSVHGLWEQPKKGFKFLRVTSVLHCTEFAPMQIPEIKK